MTIYVISFLLIGIEFILIRNRKLLSFLISLELFLIMAFRSESLGVDVGLYNYMYNRFGQMQFANLLSEFNPINPSINILSVEWGYVIVNWICYNLGLSYHTFLVINSLVFIVAMKHFVDKYSKNIWISYIIILGMGVYTYAFCILRQAFATAFVLWSVDYLYEKKYAKYIVMVFMAGLFHRTAYLSIFALLFCRITYSQVKMLRIGIIEGILLVLSISMYQFLYDRILAIIGKSSYIGGQFETNIILYLLIIALIAIIFYMRRTDDEITYSDNIILGYFVFSLFLETLACVNGAMGRVINMTYLPFLAIIFPNLFCRDTSEVNNNDEENSMLVFTKRSNVLIEVMVFTLMFIWYCITISSTSMRIVPYISMWS